MRGHESCETVHLIYHELYICWSCRIYGPEEEFAVDAEPGGER